MITASASSSTVGCTGTGLTAASAATIGAASACAVICSISFFLSTFCCLLVCRATPPGGGGEGDTVRPEYSEISVPREGAVHRVEGTARNCKNTLLEYLAEPHTFPDCFVMPVSADDKHRMPFCEGADRMRLGMLGYWLGEGGLAIHSAPHVLCNDAHSLASPSPACSTITLLTTPGNPSHTGEGNGFDFEKVGCVAGRVR